MNKLFAIIIFSFLFFLMAQSGFGQNSTDEDSTQFAQIAIDENYFNFGDMRQGERMEHVFKFSNIGTTPLILNNVLSTCGCTIPEWPKDPILADSTGNIKVVFDSTSKIGRQNKVITIRSNSKKGDFRLRISAMVLPSEKKN